MPALAEKPEKVARVDPNAPWPIVRVKDVASSIQYGLTASAAQRDDGPRFLRITDIQDGRVDWSAVPSCEIPSDQISKYQLAAGDLVFARTGATTGKSFLIGECPQAVFASYLIRVRVTSAVEPKYLAAFFQSPDYWQQIEAGKRGIGQPNVNGTILGEVQFPLPPLPEQRRIVAEIEQQFTRLDAGVAALRRTQANLKRYRAAVLKTACEGWPKHPFSKVCDVVSGYAFKSSDFCDAGIPVIKIANVNVGCLAASEANPIAFISDLRNGLSVKRFTEYGANFRPFIELAETIGPTIESDLSTIIATQLSKPISVLELTDYQKTALTGIGINTVGDALTSDESKFQRAYYIGPKRSRKIMNVVTAAVLEYLSG